MGNHNFTPKQKFSKKDQPVLIKGFSFTNEHIPAELVKNGRVGYVQTSGVMFQSRPNHPKMYVNKVKLKNGKEELFMTNDLHVGGGVADSAPVIRNPVQNRRNSGSRIVNTRYKI